MTLNETQRLFTKLLGQLLQHIYEQGYEATLGEATRSDEQATINAMGTIGRTALCTYLEANPRFHGLALAIANNGKANGVLLSLHRERLAIDLNLFKDGKYLTTNAAWEEIGIWWEQQHPLCRWGGRFGDGNHFSLEYQGRK